MRIAYFTQTRKVGNSLYVRIPKDVKIVCELNDKDYVRIEVQKVEVIRSSREYTIGEEGKEDDTNLHDDNAARQDPEARNKGIHQESRHPQMDNSEGDRVNGVQTLAGEDIHFRIL